MELFALLIKSLVRDLFKSKADLHLEIVALRQQLATYKSRGAKPHIKPRDRLFWIQLSKVCRRWRELLVFVKPETVLKWQKLRSHKMIKRNHNKVYPGAPSLPEDVVNLIEKLARENPLWGAPRIHGELTKLGIKVSERSVSRYLRQHHPRDRGQGWSTFLKNHRSAIVSIDFFHTYTITLKRLAGIAVVDHGRRKIIHVASSPLLTNEWVIQQLLNAFPGECSYKYLISDNDQLFQQRFENDVQNLLELKVRKIARFSPCMNGVTERTIGSIKREMLDHVVVINNSHLNQLLTEYQRYFNESRTHLTLEKDTPEGRPVHNPENATFGLKAKPYLGGLHHRYDWFQAV